MESDPNFNERRSKITMVCGQYDYVHGLGEPIVDPDNLYYIKTAPAEGDIGERAFSMNLSQYLFKYDIVKDSVILLEQLRTIDKRRLKDKVCHLDQEMLRKVDHALEISLELHT